MPVSPPYEPNPHYAAAGGTVQTGWAAIAGALTDRPTVLAIEGPAILGWDRCVASIRESLAARGIASRVFDMRDHFAPWPRILERTASAELPDDPDFTTLAEVGLVAFFDVLPEPEPPSEGVLIVFGPGAGLLRHDVLWYADLPKRYAEAAVGSETGVNLAQPAETGCGTTRRLFYIDWPVLDRHRDGIARRIDRWIDTQDPERPASIDGNTLRASAAVLSGQPFRTRPTFNTAPWGGNWGQRVLGMNSTARNTALGYELIAPESGVLLGDRSDARVEVPFQLLVAICPVDILGGPVHALFGTSFPIRFDYLDTVDGGNLSVHCHPQADYMRRVFGWRYTQHETYYVMVGGDHHSVFLGLRADIDLGAFQRFAQDAVDGGRAFAIEDYVQTFRADPHRLFMIPAGTPHGSGEGNVILEVSATPYLYSLRFYDWLRRDADGNHRPVHVDHAFANLDTRRRGEAVNQDLIQAPRTLRAGLGWREEIIGGLPEMFYEVRRVVLEGDDPADDDTAGRFHVINVVEGDGVVIETIGGHVHPLSYAETLVVPAAVGPYTLRRFGSGRVLIVKSLVR